MKKFKWFAVIVVLAALATARDVAVAEVPPSIINGLAVEESLFPEVVRVRANGAAFLSGVIIGPRAVLTAAHGVGNSPLVEFEHGGSIYKAMTFLSPIYPQRDHDLAAAITFDSIRGFSAARVSTTRVEIGNIVHLLGFGCSGPGGEGIGPLRFGKASVINKSELDWISNGAALCFGDSGGPAYPDAPAGILPQKVVLGIGSKGNLKDTSYFVRLDSPESEQFFKELIAAFEVQICGINSECGPIH